MHITETSAYRKAFIRYLRRGTPIVLSFKTTLEALLHHKMLGESTSYIWHSRDDAKVRPSHAANNRNIFKWDSPPGTGHPGEDFNCRCWAEPIEDSFYARQTLVSPVEDNPDTWTDLDFVGRYLGRSGEQITLPQTGLLGEVIKHYATQARARDGTIGVYNAIEKQVLEEARKTGAGHFSYSFRGNYNFQNAVIFSLGDSVISGQFIGEARKEGDFLVISGKITYDFSDIFGDPESRVENLMEEEGITREEALARLGDSVDFFGAPYAITGQWQTKFNGTVKLP